MRPQFNLVLQFIKPYHLIITMSHNPISYTKIKNLFYVFLSLSIPLVSCPQLTVNILHYFKKYFFSQNKTATKCSALPWRDWQGMHALGTSWTPRAPFSLNSHSTRNRVRLSAGSLMYYNLCTLESQYAACNKCYMCIRGRGVRTPKL